MLAMRWAVKLGLLAASAFAAVATAGQLPKMELALETQRRATVAERPHALTDAGLVAAFAGMELSERLERVGWDHGILSVDLRGRLPSLALADMRELLAYAFGGTDNVRQVLVRVFSDTADGHRLLLSAESRRGDWSASAPAAGRSGRTDDVGPAAPAMTDADFSRLVRLTATPAGQSWLANFAN